MVRFLNAAVLHRSFCRKVWKGLAPELLQAAVLFPEKVLLFLKILYLKERRWPVGEYTVQSGNTEFSAKDGVLFNADRSKLEIYPAEKEEKGYQIPEGCTEIGRYAFRDVKNLKSIDLTGVVSLE